MVKPNRTNPNDANPRVYIYGVQSSPDPDPGVSVARSLRLAFPGCRLIAVDRSAQSSGLHWPDFDEWLVLSSSSDLESLCAKMNAGEYLLVCDDDEINRLAVTQQHHDRLLMPAIPCLRQLRKPARALARSLAVEAPRSLLIPASQKTLEKFLEKSGPRVWRKGRTAGAELLNLHDKRSKKSLLSNPSHDGSKDELLQAHVDGPLEALAFAAYRGRFLNGVWMKKQGVTSKGKAWSGLVTQLSNEWKSRLKLIARQLCWHGGGGFEFVRDSEDRLWLIDANPRFPAWVHGATLCGVNLPAELLGAASGATPLKPVHKCSAFSRVVVEVGVRPQLESHLRPSVVD